MKNNRKTGLIAAAAAVIVVIVAAVLFFLLTQPSPTKTLKEFTELLQEEDYEGMYAYLSSSAQENWNKEDFINRNKNIYSGVEAHDISFTNMKSEESEEGANVTYHESMETAAGSVAFDHGVFIVKEDGNYRIDWDSSFIFPQLSDEDSISVQVLKGSRGSILDRNGEALAQDGTVYQAGFVAGSQNDGSFGELAKVLNISQDSVKQAMSASWIQDGMFVPVKTISQKDYESLKDKLDSIAGVSVQSTSGRVYPYAEICAHLTGYVQTATAEDLETYADKGYTQDTLIGKSGLEGAYEEQLHAQNGVAILVYNANGQKKDTVAEKAAVNGQDITTTIDINVQKELYEQMGSNEGAAVAMSSTSGEVLGAVSTPSYDPNDFANGMDSSAWEKLSSDEKNPLLSRFQSAYCPGSTFKAISGAIGLESKTITADTVFKKYDRWQKDDSWGDNYVTTTQHYDADSNLANALRYSDNIFFAQLADKITASTLSSSLDKLGFNETVPFELSLAKSTYGDDLNNDQKLAATGYGQGDLLVNPIHLTALYTASVNDGSILQPYLIYDKGEKKIYKENAYSSETAKIMLEDLRKTMDSYGENATNAAGKTGSAEVDNGKEVIGWTCAVNDQVALTVMMENTKEEGSSLYVEPIAEKILENITK